MRPEILVDKAETLDDIVRALAGSDPTWVWQAAAGRAGPLANYVAHLARQEQALKAILLQLRQADEFAEMHAVLGDLDQGERERRALQHAIAGIASIARQLSQPSGTLERGAESFRRLGETGMQDPIFVGPATVKPKLRADFEYARGGLAAIVRALFGDQHFATLAEARDWVAARASAVRSPAFGQVTTRQLADFDEKLGPAPVDRRSFGHQGYLDHREKLRRWAVNTPLSEYAALVDLVTAAPREAGRARPDHAVRRPPRRKSKNARVVRG